MTHTKINHLESKKMKICLIVDDYMPDSIKVAAKMMHELAIEFQKNGHIVTVITPNPKLNKELDIITLDGVKICRFKSGEIKNVSKVKRAINETMLSYKAWNICNPIFKNDKHDLIVYYSPTIFFGLLVKKLKKLWNAPSYLILRDIFPQWVIDNGMLKENSLITKYFKYFESINYNSADIIGLMSQENLNWFNQKHNNRYKTELLYNWASDTPTLNEDNGYRKKLNLEDKIIYFYGGNMGHAQDMMNLIRLAKNMQEFPKAHFLFVGAGDEVETMKDTVKEQNIKNTTILPAVNQKKFLEILSQVDVGLFTLNYNHKTHNFPGKLLGYMCESKPILGSINPHNDLKEVVKSANAGLISVNGEDELLFENAKKLLDDESRKTIGENANKLLKDSFSVEATVKQILESTK